MANQVHPPAMSALGTNFPFAARHKFVSFQGAEPTHRLDQRDGEF